MTDGTGEPPTRRGRPGGDNTVLAIQGLLAGAGSFFLLTGSALITTVVSVLAVLLAVITTRGNGSGR